MIIKKYLANTEAEAVDAAKKELGQGVVVMNVRNVKHKGIMRFFKNPMKEVTVALEEENERLSSAVKDIAKVVRESEAALSNQSTSQAKESSTSYTVKEQTDSVDRRERTSFRAEISEQSANIDRKQTDDKNLEDDNLSDMEAKLNSIKNLLQDTLNITEAAKDAEKEEEPSEAETFIKLLYNTMIENEVHERYVNAIIDDLEKDMKKDTPIDYLLANVYQKMVLKFGQPSVIVPAKNNAKILFFIGPTGVGKTTTIAKIASKFSVEQKKRIALLTTDTYRIAAAEQLRTYANILDVPFRVIYSLEEMHTALRDFKQYDYILIDTAGHSHQNEEQKNVMKDYLDSVEEEMEKEVLLVVSATTKYKDLISIADTYSDMTEYKLIFTKLDETLTLGNLLNLRLHTGAAMSYVTCGQNVPDDIEEFNPQSTVRRLLGGKSK